MGPSALGSTDLERALLVHLTEHAAMAPSATDEVQSTGSAIQSVFRGIVEDDERTRPICTHIAAAVRAGRNCLALSQWTGHVARLVEGLKALGMEPLVLQGGMGKKDPQSRHGRAGESGTWRRRDPRRHRHLPR